MNDPVENPGTEPKVAWDVALHIWWAIAWRSACIIGILRLVPTIFRVSTPVIYASMLDFSQKNWELVSFSTLFLYFLAILWSVRASLRDDYSSFHFTAIGKRTGKSIFNYEHRLSWYVCICFLWAWAWRTFIVPAAIFGGVILAAHMTHRDIKTFTALAYIPVLARTSIFATVLFSLWAMWEALGDKYYYYRFIIWRKHIYENTTPDEHNRVHPLS